jgi:hypothetical protein
MRPRFAQLALVPTLLLLGCASGGGGGAGPGTTLVGNTPGGGVMVMTGDGESLEIRRGGDLRAIPRIEAPVDQAWRVLPLVYELMGVEPDGLLPAERRLTVSQVRFQRQIMGRRPSDFFECGYDPGMNRLLADMAPIDASIETRLVSVSGGGTEVRTSIRATTRPTGGSAGRANCESSGLFETIVARLTQEFVDGRTP